MQETQTQMTAVSLPFTDQDDGYPLSVAQERVWFLEQLDPGAAAQHLAVAVRIEGKLDPVVLWQSLRQIAGRHDALRMTFASVHGRPVQKVVPDVGIELPVIDLSGLAESEQQARVQQAFQEEVWRPFDLSCPPLWRATLIRLGPEEHILALIWHQLIGDSRSGQILVHDIGSMYQAILEGRPLPSELPGRLTDLIQQEKAWLESDEAQAQLTYWRSQLGGSLPVLELPADRLRPAIQTFRGAHHTFVFSPSLADSLRILSCQMGLDLRTVLLAGFQTLLSRYTGLEDVIVGCPARYPQRDAIHGPVGPLDNVLVLRTPLSGRLTFRELLRLTQETIRNAYAHRDFPFARLVDVLQPARSLSHPPLFQVMFDFVQAQSTPAILAELGWMNIRLEDGISRYDLSLTIEDTGQALVGVVEYNTDLFDPATIDRLTGHFQALLVAACAAPDTPLSRLSILTADERRQLVTVWNQTEADFPRETCIHTLFEAQVDRAPDAIALVCEDERLTYRELNQRANRLAHYLQKLGVGPEVPVGVFLKRSPEMVIGLLAILKAGGAYVPLDPAYPAERLAFMLEDTKVPVVLAQSCLLPRLPSSEARVICLDDSREDFAWESAENPISTVVSDNLSYIIYTSGSTGRPKGVAIAHRSAVAMLSWATQVFSDEDLRGVLAATSICFDLSVYELFLPLSRGGTIILAENALHLLTLPAREAVTLINTVPSAITELVQANGIPGSVRTVNLAGEPLKGVVVQQVYQCGTVERVYNLYGPSEDTVYSTFALIRREDLWRGEPTIGRPISNTQAYILDAHMELVPVGVVGELYLGGAGLSRGYLNRPAITAQSYVPDPFGSEPGSRLYRTGDLVRYRPNGEIEFLGRRDHQVKIRGFRIELGEIEAVLSQHPRLKAVAVLARQDAPGDRRLVAYLVADQPPPPTVSELRRFLQTRLPDYMLPAAYVYLEAMPLTSSGKIDRRALPAPASERPELEEAFVAPRTPVEEKVASVWCDVLRLEKVGVHDDFFALGGHSLLATQVISRLAQIFAVEIPLPLFFKQPTIAGLAQEIAQREGEGQKAIPLVPTAREGALPLSFSQEEIWFIEQLIPGTPLYNVPVVLQATGMTDAEVVERCLNELMRRHEVLRTTFGQVDGRPVQIVLPSQPIRLSAVDLRPLPAEERQAHARRLMMERARQPFDLSRGPLWRALLLRLDDQRCQLLLTFHHIVFDGWSTGVLIEELGTLYPSFAKGEPVPLPDLPVQYADFVHWQRQYLQGATLAEHQDYWREQFRVVSPLVLPADRHRPAVQTFCGARESCPLPAELVAASRSLGHQENASLFMTLFAAFAALLSRYSGQTDIVAMVPIANRNHLEIERLIGCFINTLPLRADLSGDPTFRELIRRVHQVSLGALAHQALPLGQIVKSIAVRTDPLYNPLFRVMLAFQNLPANSIRWPGGGLSFVEELDTGTSKVDLTLFIDFPEQGPTLTAEYNTDLFTADTIRRLLGHFCTLLAGAVADPDRRLSELPLLTEGERQQIVVEWNATEGKDSAVVAGEAERAACIHELFEAQVRRTPEETALVCGDRRLTYRELNRRANQLAHHLRGLGVGPEVCVGVYMTRSVEMVVGLLGILKAGGAYVPLDPGYPPERLDFMVEDCQARVLLTEEQLMTRLPTRRATVVCVEAVLREVEQGSDETIGGARGENLAYVIYTSGSTGKPKGVAIEHQSAVSLIRWAVGQFGVEAFAGTLFSTSICFDLSVFELFVPLSCGGKVILVQDVLQLADLPVAEEVTLVNTVPSAMTELLRLAELPASVRVVNLAGEPLKSHLVRQIYRQRGVEQVFDLYGPTEDTTYTTWARRSPEGPETIGRPIANSQVYVLDAYLNPVPVGVPGVLYIGGGGLARGYLYRPGLTAERFIPNPFSDMPGARLYNTGDLARWLPDGNLEFLGRVDHQVKIRGFRIELGEIEAVLLGHPAVREAVVVAREEGGAGLASAAAGPESGLDKRLIAYMVPEAGKGIVLAELRRFLQERLPAYMIPSAFVILEAFPLLPNGKVDRRALPVPSSMRPELESAYVAPRTPTEEVLASIWARVLELDQVGVHDNFFELGGHSLLATQVMSRVRDDLKVELPVRALFESPTVAGLAERVERARQAQQGLSFAPVAPAVSRGGEIPLSFAQERLWFLDQWEPGNPIYNIPRILRLSGLLDVAVLERSFNEIVRRHEALRTVFAAVDGRPYQVILSSLEVPLRVVDFSELEEAERAAAVERLSIEETQWSFDLRRGPLIRAALVRLAAEEHLLFLNVHHIVADGWSLERLIEELGVLYRAFSAGEASPLPELPVQYADWAVWQREWLRGERLERQLAYWRQQLGGDIPVLALPTDRPRPPVQSYRGAALTLELSESLSRALRALSRREGCTLFMTLLASLKTLLYRYTGQSDIIVGAPIAGRGFSQIEGLIGFFLNTLALRTDLSGNPSFCELLQRVREVTLAAYAHQDVPFEKLLEELQPERDLSRTPLFQVFFNMLNLPGGGMTLPGLKVESLPLPEIGAKFDLTFYIEEVGNRIVLELVYNVDLFSAERMGEMLEQLRHLLSQIVANPGQKIDSFSLVTPGVRERLPQPALELNDDWVGGVHELFAKQARCRPEGVAVADSQDVWSYGELEARSNQLANYLLAQGLCRGEVVAVYGHRSASLVWAVFGILKAGAAFVILDPAYPAARLVENLRLVRPAGWLQIGAAGDLAGAMRAFVEEMPCRCRLELPRRHVAAATHLLAGYSVEAPGVQVGADDRAYIALTSGSTGKPKGIEGRHGPLTHFLPWQKERFGLDRSDRYSMLSGLAHDPLQRDIFTPLALGASLCIPDPEQIGTPGWLAEWMQREKITITHLTPAMVQVLTQTALAPGSAAVTIPSLRYAFIVGDVLTRQDVIRLQKCAPAVTCVNFYGSTETQRAVGYYPVCREEVELQREIIPLGRGIQDVQLLILNSALELAGVGELGEIYVRSPHLARGYLGDQELTDKCFIVNPFTGREGDRLYKTGDLGRYLPDGNVEFAGRADDQLKVRGFRIEPREVELVLVQHPDVQEAVVVGRADGDQSRPWDRRLVAYVVPRNSVEPTASALSRFLRERLPDYMVPSAFVTLSALPLTPNGKIDYRALPAPDRGRPRLEKEFVAPRTATEQVLSRIWADLLRLDRVGVHDNFFELGGHSLLATRVVSRVRDAFQIELPLRSLFEMPTVAGLAQIVETQLQRQGVTSGTVLSLNDFEEVRL